MAQNAVIDIRVADLDEVKSRIARADAEIARLREALTDIREWARDKHPDAYYYLATVLAVEWIP